ncbi:MAG TPA: OsmC family protein [Thermoanaerobaculia bacterium]|nr:OsmC family protein [Thermoanaerobaculia bacterium]
MHSEPLQIPGAGSEPPATLDLPLGTPVAQALIAHAGAPRVAEALSCALVQQGLAVLRLAVGADLEGAMAEVRAAVDVLRQARGAPQLLVGHGSGGAAVLGVVGGVGGDAGISAARAVALVACPAGEVQEAALGTLRRPFLLLHSPVDNVVGIDHARRLYEAARHPKSFVSLGMADHLLSDPRDARFAAEMVAAWAGRYVEATGEMGVVPGQVEVRGGAQGLTQEVVAGHHWFESDEPVEVPGGGDAGPNPYELLLAALGGCTAMTLRIYADRQKLPLTGVRVRLRHSRIHAKDCAACQTQEGRITRLERVIELDGPLDPEQRALLLGIADRCPVHRTLVSEMDIQTRLA